LKGNEKDELVNGKIQNQPRKKVILWFWGKTDKKEPGTASLHRLKDSRWGGKEKKKIQLDKRVWKKEKKKPEKSGPTPKGRMRTADRPDIR